MPRTTSCLTSREASRATRVSSAPSTSTPRSTTGTTTSTTPLTTRSRIRSTTLGSRASTGCPRTSHSATWRRCRSPVCLSRSGTSPSPTTQPLFSVHSDSAPTVYVNNNPGPTDPSLRHLERDVSNAQALDPYVSNQKTPVALYLADKVGEKVLHMQTADGARTPSFTLFANPDYFLTAGVTGGVNPTKFNCPDAAHQASVCVDYHFA